jgi:hypothetical protein
MEEPRARSDAKSRGADGVTIAPAPGGRKALLLLAAGAAIAAIVLLSLFGPERRGPTPVAATEVARATGGPDASTPSPTRVHPVRARGSAPPPPARAPAPAEARPEEPDPPDGEPSPQAPSGIQLFPPRGTDPPKIGIIVPEGFELPEGYVRHYQATDDGQPLPPILMFHPDYDWIDENGEHVEVSPDGVVPPELAPPGMPIEMLELPEPPSQP